MVPWLHPPRWLFGMSTNAFVDQDTYLLATQQGPTLTAELDLARQHGLLPDSPASSSQVRCVVHSWLLNSCL